MALAALEAGKHALVIKPFATNRADAEAVRAAAKKTGLVAVLGYNRCFMPPVNELRKRVAAGALGTLLHAEGNFCVDRYGHLKPGGDWKTDRDQVLPGSLADHMLYGLIELLGPVAEVHAHGASLASSIPIAETTAVLLRFRNGTSGLLTAIGVTPDYYRLAVFGTKGWIELRGSDEFTFQPKEGEAEMIRFPKFDAERAELEAFADAVAGTKPFPYSLDNAVHSAAVLEAMGASAKSGKPVGWFRRTSRATRRGRESRAFARRSITSVMARFDRGASTPQNIVTRTRSANPLNNWMALERQPTANGAP